VKNSWPTKQKKETPEGENLPGSTSHLKNIKTNEGENFRKLFLNRFCL
jgi:hypothetical protein